MEITKAWYAAAIMERITHAPVRHKSRSQQGGHFCVNILSTLRLPNQQRSRRPKTVRPEETLQSEASSDGLPQGDRNENEDEDVYSEGWQ
jgi:hypothetical protein